MSSRSSQIQNDHHVMTSARNGRPLIPVTDQSSTNGICSQCHQSLKTSRGRTEDPFQTTLQKYFPNAYGLEEFVFETKQTLVPKGFYPHVNTLVCIGLCRDEITSPFEEEVESMWGQGFICGSLGGMLFCGKTGFAAAHHHAPDDGRFIYYCFTHIAIDHEGNIGSVYRTRSGMNEKTTACGALAAFASEIASNKLNLHFDEADIEMSMLKKHIAKQTDLLADPKKVPDLLAVTMAAYQTITSDLENHVRHDASHFKDRQYALFTGVQIHGPNGTDYCWLGKASLMKNGVFTPLSLTSNAKPQSSTASRTKQH